MTKRPLIVEFTGLPGAGQDPPPSTCWIATFAREGWHIWIIMEGAQACPISQEHRLLFTIEVFAECGVLIQVTSVPAS